MTNIETKEARLNELQAEIKNITDELLGDENISDTRDAYLRSLRIDARREMEAIKAEIDAEIDANIEKVAAQKVDAILTSGVQPVIVTTTFKNNRCSVNIDGAKVSLDKAVTILCESELARRGENVLLINENSDVCPLDEDLFILGKHNVKTAIRQFARGEKVTGAKVINGKFYPVVKANADPAAEPAVEETAIAEPANVEESDREKYLKAKEQIKAAPDRLLDNGNFTTKWLVRDEHGNWNRTNKGNAATILNAFGLDIFTYLDEHEKWVVENVAISARNAAAEDFARRIVAPAKMLALPAPAPVAEPAVEEPDGYNPDVFSLLPKREDLNDVDGEFDEDAAEYTDRDDRYNRGEKIAEGLTAKLRAFDPTVEVTFAIDDDEDTYYLSYAGIIRTPFTATGVEASFHAMKQREAKPEEPAENVKYVATQITYPNGHEGEPTREVSKTFDNLDDAARFIADDNPFIETETGFHTFAYDDGYFGGVYWAGYRIETTDGKILVEADIYEVKGDESIDRLVIKYINDNDNTVPEPPADNPLACLNNLGYEDDVIEPVRETVDETDTSKEYAVTIAQLKDAYDSAVAAWGAIDYNARTHKSLRPVAKTALATVTAAGTALQAFGDAHLAQLCPLLDQTIRGATIRIINEDGIDWGSQKLADISLKFRRTGPDFAIIANDNYYATCATPDDVRRVIERLKQSITCGAAEFSFAPQFFTPDPVDDDDDADEYASISEDGITYVSLARGHNVSADRFYLKVQGFPVTEYQRTTALPSDTVAGVARICATVNAVAPEGWEVYYDTPSKLFAVVHNDETVARLTSVELYDAWDAHPPEDFFNAYDTHDVVEFDDDGNISAIWF